MRYVVTGGAGFIGSHIVEHLVRAGHQVVVLDNLSTGSRANLRGVEHLVTLIVGSVTDLEATKRACEGADFVIHQAVLPSVPRSVRDPVSTHEHDATGTLNVLIAARDAGVRRVVYAGSSSAYGNTEELPKHEAMVPNPRSPYAVAKLAGEHYCRAFHATYALETVVLRYFNIFGPRQDPASEYAAVVPRFIVAALEGRAPTITGDGEQTRDFTFVRNAVHANLLACEAPAAACGETFNVGCGERVSLNTLWRRIQDAVGVELPARYVERRAGDVRDSLASLEKSGRLLGYAPLVTLDAGIRETVASLRERLAVERALAEVA